jgi:hypothetical protein
MPEMTANNKNKYPDNKLILFIKSLQIHHPL